MIHDVPQAILTNMYITIYICYELLDIKYYIFSIKLKLYVIVFKANVPHTG